MASPTSPTHGRFGAIYQLRPNGFIGDGLNDMTWGTAFSGADSAYFEVEVDANGTPDTFQWRKDGGAYTTGVSITGAAQTLSDGQTVTFAATTGHTIGDTWAAGNLKDEPTTESGAEAQITDALMRILDPNNPPTFTDDGGASVLTTNYTNGLAVFDANAGNVDVDGNLGYIPAAAIAKVGYLQDWQFTASLDMADISACGDVWKTGVPGLAGGNGSATKLFIGTRSFMDSLVDNVDGTQAYFFLKLFNYDPDQDGTGDHILAWVTFSSLSVAPSLGDVVKETINFQLYGGTSFIANS